MAEFDPADFGMVEGGGGVGVGDGAPGLPTMLCCNCGAPIAHNPTAMCAQCLSSRVDITEGIPTQVKSKF